MKLLATDYDGTLRYADKVMEEDIEAIKKWKDKGYLFSIVTGRSLESITEQIKMYNLPCDYIVTNNGGMVFDGQGVELMASYLDYVTSLDVIYIAKESENVASYVVNDGKVRHRVVVNEDVEEHRYPNLKQDWKEEQVLDMGQFAQIVISMSSPEEALHMAEQINQYFSNTVIAYANNFVVDVVPKGVSKATGLDFVATYTDVEEKDIYSIGDAHNDIPMIEYGENGMAMDLAPEDVKQFAKNTYSSISDMIQDIL